MKKFLTSLIVLSSLSALAAPVQVNEKANILGQLAVEENTSLHPSVVRDVQSIISGQTYTNRVSVTSFTCTKGQLAKCEVTIGKDNTSDDDSGWSELYKIKVQYDRKRAEVESTEFVPMAG